MRWVDTALACVGIVEGARMSSRSWFVKGAVLTAGASPALATTALAEARALSTSEFYVRYPYRVVEDALRFVEATAERNPDSVLAALELWGERYPMYQIGGTKGVIVDRVVKSTQPLLAVEIGSFLGYSAVRIGRLLPVGARLVCIEASPDFAAIAEAVVRYARLSASFVVAKGSDCAASLGSSRIDFLFLDHAKSCYAPDLLKLEDAGLVQRGTVVLADNVVYPGAPGYLEHVAAPRYETKLVPAPYESVGWETAWKVVDDAMAVSTRL